MSRSRPPLLSDLLARVAVRGPRAEFLRAGLREELERRAAEDPRAARAWYRRQVRAAVLEWWRPENVRIRRQLGRADRRNPPGSTSPRPQSPSPGIHVMDRILQDLRFAIRSFFAQPTLAAMAIGALALGTGGATALFTVVDAVVLRPLPFPEPDRIMTVWETSGDWLHNPAAPANFIDWRERAESFASLAALTGAVYNLSGIDEPLRLSGYRVTAEFHDVLGVSPVLGRRIDSTDDRFGAERVVLLGHDLWTRAFGADLGVVGRDVRLDGEPWTVIGVMPRGFSYPLAGVDVWTPMAFSPDEEARRGFRSFHVIGRLADGVGPSAAHEEMVGIADALRREYPDDNGHVSANVIPLREEWLGSVRPTLIAMVGAVGLLLLVACINVANLLLARAVGRTGEIALRAAIGAGPGRIVQQTLTEGVLLALVGSGVGVLLAVQASTFLRTLVPAWVPLADRVGVDLRAVAFSTGLALATSVAFGLAPALRALRLDLVAGLRGDRATDLGTSRRRWLIVAQVALAIVLLIGAGLLVRSFAAVAGQDLGFDAEGVLVAGIDPGGERYATDEDKRRLYQQLLERVTALPGADTAALITRVPLGMSGGALIYTPFDQPTPPMDATYRVATPDYFRTLGIALRGREFTPADRTPVEPEVIVGEELARRHWPGRDAIGQRLKIGEVDSDTPWLRVIGVAADVRQWDIELEPRPAIYVPLSQGSLGFFAPRHLVVRTAGSPAELVPSVRAALAEIDPELPLSGAGALAERVERATAARRFQMSLLTAFAATAACIAMIGLYGIIAYMVQARTRELGIRLALGAGRRRVVLFVMRQGAFLVGAGAAIGLAGAVLAGRVVEGLLYRVSPLDPLTFIAVPLGLAVVALAALLVPALRAAGVDPVRALRGE